MIVIDLNGDKHIQVRVMSGAKDLAGALPDTLTSTSTITVQCRSAVVAEIEVLRQKLVEAGRRKAERRDRLKALKRENLRQQEKSKETTEAYWRREREREGVAETEADLTGKLQSRKVRNTQLHDQIRMLETEMKKRQSMRRELGGDETDSVVYSAALEKIDFTELRSFQEEKEQRRMQELEEVSLKIKVGGSVQF